jgi:hypothetical protein
VHLIVTATPEVWANRWTASASDAEVRLRSPDARTLVESELRACGADDKAIVLDDPPLAPIWKLAPKARKRTRRDYGIPASGVSSDAPSRRAGALARASGRNLPRTQA